MAVYMKSKLITLHCIDNTGTHKGLPIGLSATMWPLPVPAHDTTWDHQGGYLVDQSMDMDSFHHNMECHLAECEGAWTQSSRIDWRLWCFPLHTAWTLNLLCSWTLLYSGVAHSKENTVGLCWFMTLSKASLISVQPEQEIGLHCQQWVKPVPSVCQSLTGMTFVIDFIHNF